MVVFLSSTVCYLILLFFDLIEMKNKSKTEGDLYKVLLTNYEPLERPVENSSDPVVVKMGLVLQQIVDVDEKNQVIDVNAWLKFSWNDYSLKWNPSEYGGVNDLRFRKSQIWIPDILLYNSADPQFDSRYASNALVYPNGLVNWMPPGLYRFSCKIQVVWFPFDVQECFLKFGSWTFDGTKLSLEIDENGFDTSGYMQNGEWQLESTGVERNIQYYQCCPEPYYDLVFTFIIRRRALYYAFNLILPCILITMLTLVGFTLPPDAGEKMSLQITIMFSICIFQNYVAELSPPTSESVPFLGAFFAVCLFTCACCVTATTLALNFHHRNGKSHEMSNTFRVIMLDWLPWLLMMRRPGHRAKDWKLIRRYELDDDYFEERRNRLEQQRISRIISNLSAPSTNPTVRRVTIASDKKPPRQPQQAPIEQITQLLVLQQVHGHLSDINRHMRERERCKRIEDDWKFSALVVDRICILVFTSFLIGSTVALFSSVPQILRSF